MIPDDSLYRQQIPVVSLDFCLEKRRNQDDVYHFPREVLLTARSKKSYGHLGINEKEKIGASAGAKYFELSLEPCGPPFELGTFGGRKLGQVCLDIIWIEVLTLGRITIIQRLMIDNRNQRESC